MNQAYYQRLCKIAELNGLEIQVIPDTGMVQDAFCGPTTRSCDLLADDRCLDLEELGFPHCACLDMREELGADFVFVKPTVVAYPED
jgi:hypothetical protein